MVYHGSDLVEIIQVHPMDDLKATHYINLVKSADTPTFYVTCCCDDEWGYEFYLENNADYERVKFNIMEAIFECEDVVELLDELRDMFEDNFADILIGDVCDDDCENNEYLN